MLQKPKLEELEGTAGLKEEFWGDFDQESENSLE
jgi:hypothetical protein